MKDKILGNRIHFIVFGSISLILVFFYVVLFLLNRDILLKYDNRVLPSIYLDSIDLSNYEYEEAKAVILDKMDEILSQKVRLVSKNFEEEYTLEEIGFTVDMDKTFQRIQDFQKDLSYSKKILYINGHGSEVIFPIYYQLDIDTYEAFSEILKEKLNVSSIPGYYDTDLGKYIPGQNGYQVNFNKTREKLEDYFDGNYDLDEFEIEVVGKEIEVISFTEYSIED